MTVVCEQEAAHLEDSAHLLELSSQRRLFLGRTCRRRTCWSAERKTRSLGRRCKGVYVWNLHLGGGNNTRPDQLPANDQICLFWDRQHITASSASHVFDATPGVRLVSCEYGDGECCPSSKPRPAHRVSQSALFNFQSLLRVILLLVCTCTYVRAVAPRLIDRNKQGSVFSLLPVHLLTPLQVSWPFLHVSPHRYNSH